jgi:hypothetical protein
VRRITERPSRSPVLSSAAPATRIKGGPLVSASVPLSGIVLTMTSALPYWVSGAPRAPLPL